MEEKNEKIGILTFNRAINYGAVLQAYALKTAVEKYHEVEIINYVNPHIEEVYKYRGNPLKKIILEFLLYKKQTGFANFIKENSSEKVYNKDDVLQSDYDKIIVGSDQVWNYKCSGDDETYLLPNVFAKKYSYAGSFGVSSLPEDQVPFFQDCLSKFRYLSVREKTGEKICREQLGVEANTVLDPTLLLSEQEWVNSLHIRNTRKKYLLTYIFDKGNQYYIETAKKMSRLLNVPIYDISLSIRERFGNKSLKNVGPKDWVSLFHNASFVVTDSFHGTAFSLNFNKPFYSFANNDRASRIVDLLSTLGMESRLNPTLDNLHVEDIDYTLVNAKLKEERNKSMAFIEKIIHD